MLIRRIGENKPSTEIKNPFMLFQRSYCLLFFLIGVQFLLFLTASPLAYAQNNSWKRYIFGSIEISLPREFRKLSRKEISKENPPNNLLSIWTHRDQPEMRFVVQKAPQKRWAKGDEEIMQSFLRANFLQLYDEVTFLAEGTALLGSEDKGIFFEFMGKLSPDAQRPIEEQRYIYILAFVGKEGEWVVYFDAPSHMIHPEGLWNRSLTKQAMGGIKTR